MLSIKTILHPTDFSAPSEYAFRLATSLASDYQAQLVIIHVVPAPLYFGDGLLAPGDVASPDDLPNELLDMTVPDDLRVVRHLEEGKPAAEILNLAQLSHADMIVMGTHGRRGLDRFFMGSVVEEVMRAARCPVLVVRTPVAQVEGNHSALLKEATI